MDMACNVLPTNKHLFIHKVNVNTGQVIYGTHDNTYTHRITRRYLNLLTSSQQRRLACNMNSIWGDIWYL